MTKGHTVALVGTPNCGKTTLFNALTGLRQKTANYPGVTVEKKEGLLKRGDGTSLIDLPGIYNLNARTQDEIVSRDVLLGRSSHTRRPAAVLLILDGSTLEHSLALAASLLPLNLPMVAAVTMFDEIKARGGSLDLNALSRELGLPIIPVIGHRGIGLDALRAQLGSWRSWPAPTGPQDIADPASRYSWAQEILGRCLRVPLREDALTRRIDKVVLHPVAGPLIFLAVMTVFFQSIFTWARPAMDLMTGLCRALGVLLGPLIPNEILRSLVVDGLLNGVGSVVAFLPQILILFFFLFLLEDIGYMARAAFLMDRLMGWVGLQGRSFIALISSYACAVPAIMATRVIPSPQDRLATILVAPFVTCSARLPVYALFIAAFIPDQRVLGPLRLPGLVLFALYLLGGLSALGAAWLLRSSLLKGHIAPFFMELPPYRFPTLRGILLAMLERARIFLKRAGTIILGVSLIVWALLAFPRSPAGSAADPAAQIRRSWAGRMGQAMEPVFRPLGFDWRINVGILSSLPARETMVATLGQIYAAQSGQEDVALSKRLREPGGGQAPLGLPVALSVLAFFVYALQCFSTLAIMRRETNSWLPPLMAFCAMLACAYAASFITYRTALAFGF